MTVPYYVATRYAEPSAVSSPDGYARLARSHPQIETGQIHDPILQQRESGLVHGTPTLARTEDFLRVLDDQIGKTQPTSVSRVVKKGDNLWNLVKQELISLGRQPDPKAILESISRVAQANRLSNSDLIHIGQVLDFSALNDVAETVANATVPESVILPEEFALPVDGKITSHFGLREDPFNGELAFHKGMDIAAPKGTRIQASADGTVIFSGWRKGYGNVVEIDHANGITSLYGHNEKNLVTVGQWVKKGSDIARVGATGRATGPHVHFELREGQKAVDPIAFVSRGVRFANTITSQRERRFPSV
ncbi:MAG TPA: peptidoglycan DD-metalloendopeptidase family protein [bacterium]|nr:peptidoglycan DD-metalloendopeptidase family protein [bacterium]